MECVRSSASFRKRNYPDLRSPRGGSPGDFPCDRWVWKYWELHQLLQVRLLGRFDLHALRNQPSSKMLQKQTTSGTRTMVLGASETERTTVQALPVTQLIKKAFSLGPTQPPLPYPSSRLSTSQNKRARRMRELVSSHIIRDM